MVSKTTQGKKPYGQSAYRPDSLSSAGFKSGAVVKNKKDKKMEDIVLHLMDFSLASTFITMQIGDGKKYVVAPDIIGVVKVGKKVMLITKDCDMICQYNLRLGYEVFVYEEGEAEPTTIISMDRKELDKCRQRVEVKLVDFMGDRMKKRSIELRVEQILKRVNS